MALPPVISAMPQIYAVQKQNIHASCVLVGDAGILIRGASGSGKSSMALALMALFQQQKQFCLLVADDRTGLEAMNNRLIASSSPSITGLIERRGLGLVPQPHEPNAVIRLVVDCLGAEPERMPEPEALVAQLLGITLPRIAVFGRSSDATLVLAALALFAA